MLASEYGRYGYRRIWGLLDRAGWRVNLKRIARIWRREGLRVPQKQPQRGRLWLADGSCLRLRPCWPHHVWAYDFVEDRTHDGRKFRMLTVIEEYTRECLAIEVARRLSSDDVLDVLARLMADRGSPNHIPSDQGPEFTANRVRAWLGDLGVRTALIEKASPVGERLQRVLQWQAPGRAAQPGDLLHNGRGPYPGRALAAPLQSCFITPICLCR